MYVTRLIQLRADASYSNQGGTDVEFGFRGVQSCRRDRSYGFVGEVGLSFCSARVYIYFLST